MHPVFGLEEWLHIMSVTVPLVKHMPLSTTIISIVRPACDVITCMVSVSLALGVVALRHVSEEFLKV